MANTSGDWGHNDWNGNGTYDSYDNMMDYEFEQEYYKSSGSNYGGPRKKSGNGSWVVIVIALILGLFWDYLMLMLKSCKHYIIGHGMEQGWDLWIRESILI